MNRKRYRVSEYNNDNKKYKSETDDAKDRTYNITTRSMTLIVLDRINILEKSLKASNDEIIKLQHQNIQYAQRLTEVYNFIGLHTSPFYNHVDSYIS
jgi:hypothetical protein